MESFVMINNTVYSKVESLPQGLFTDNFLYQNSENNKKVLVKQAKERIQALLIKSNQDLTKLLNEPAITHENYTLVLQVDQERDNLGGMSINCITEYYNLTLLELLSMCPSLSIDEGHAIFIIKQLASILEYLQIQKVLYLTLRLDDILLDSKMLVKLSDYCITHTFIKLFNEEFAWMKELDKKKSSVAPEIFNRRAYEDNSVVFNLGVILFNMLTGVQPFFELRYADVNYRSLLENKEEDFWANIGKARKKLNISKEAKELIFKMLRVEPSKRCSLSDIINSEWIAQNESSQEKLQQFYDERCTLAMKKLSSPYVFKDEGESMKKKSFASAKGRFNRSEDDEADDSVIGYFRENSECLVIKEVFEIGKNLVKTFSFASDDIFSVANKTCELIHNVLPVKTITSLKDGSFSIRVELLPSEDIDDEVNCDIDSNSFIVTFAYYLQEGGKQVIAQFKEETMTWRSLIMVCNKFEDTLCV